MSASTRPIPSSIRQASEELDRFIMERSQKEVRSPTAVSVRPPALLRAPAVMESVKRVHPTTHVQAHADRPIATPPEEPQRPTMDKMRLLTSLKENEKLRHRLNQLVIENEFLKKRCAEMEKRLKEIDKIYDG